MPDGGSETRMAASDKIRVGVIGVGIGREHLDCYGKRGDAVEIVGICDLNEARGKKSAADFGVKTFVTDYRDLLALRDLDAVSVCVPNHLHAEMSVAGLESGKHVLCEKPMTDTLANAEKIVAAVAQSDRHFMMAMNNRFSGETQLLKRMIDAGELGEIYFVKCGWIRRSGIPGLGGWFTTRALSGGGPLVDIGVHALDRAMYLMGSPAPVSVSGVTYAHFGPRGRGGSAYGAKPEPDAAPNFDVEDLAAALVKFDNGASLFLEASWASYIGAEQFYASLLGTEGGADLPDFGKLRVYTDRHGAPVDIIPQPERLSGRQGEINHFIQCIQENTPPLATATQGLHTLQILDAIYRSAQTGREVRITQS